MNDLDTLVRDALALQASRAPHPDVVRGRLEARLRHRPRNARSLRVVVPVGAAFAVAGVLAAGSLLGGPGGSLAASPGTTSGATAPASSSSPPAQDPWRSVALRYSPAKLPDGLREVSRSFGPEGLSRTWRPGQFGLDDSGSEPQLFFAAVDVPSPSEALRGATRVTVAGAPAWVLGSVDDKLVLEWRIADGVTGRLVTFGLGLNVARLVEVAASVKPDGRTATFPLDSGLEARKSDAKAPNGTITITGPGRWMATESGRNVLVSVGTKPHHQLPGTASAPAQDVVVDGRPARFVPASGDHSYAELVVTLPAGRFLSVAVNASGPPSDVPATQESLVRIAGQVRWSEPSFA